MHPENVTPSETGPTWKHYTKWNRSNTRTYAVGFRFYEAEVLTAWRQKVEYSPLPSYCVKGTGCIGFGGMKRSGNGLWWGSHDIVNVPKTNELYAEKCLQWYILCSSFVTTPHKKQSWIERWGSALWEQAGLDAGSGCLPSVGKALCPHGSTGTAFWWKH